MVSFMFFFFWLYMKSMKSNQHTKVGTCLGILSCLILTISFTLQIISKYWAFLKRRSCIKLNKSDRES